MYRIDNASAVPTLPLVPPTYVPGFFTDGNPASGAEATILDAWWLNMVQEEVLAVVEAAGLPPDKADNTQLYQAIQAIAQAANPDLSAYLPLAGGTLSGPGNLIVAGNFTVTSGRGVIRSGGWPSLVLYNTVDSLASGYAIGAGSGVLRLGVNDGNGVPINGLQVQSDGGVTCLQGFASTGIGTFLSTLQVNGNLQVSGGYIVKPDNAAIYLTGAAGANMADLVLGANNITARGFLLANSLQSTGDFSVGGTCYLNSGVNAGSLTTPSMTLTGHGIAYTGLGSGNAIGWIWDGANLVFRVDGQANGGLWIEGPVRAGGALSGSHLSIYGGADVVGTANVGWANSAGDFALIAGGAFSSNGDIDICQTGTRANVGNLNLRAHFTNVMGDLRVTGGITERWPGIVRDDAIAPYEHGLEAIRQLTPMIYGERRFVGLALEDCRIVLPEMILPAAAEASDAEEGLNANPLLYAMVNAINELAERLEAFEEAWPTPAPA